MNDKLRNKLPADIERFQSQEFLEAAMAVCALAATADEKVSFPERLKIDDILAKEPALNGFGAEEANDILDGYIRALGLDAKKARRVLSEKVGRMAGDQEASQKLIRVAYQVIGADHKIQAREKSEFNRLCGLLDLDAVEVWSELAP